MLLLFSTLLISAIELAALNEHKLTNSPPLQQLKASAYPSLTSKGVHLEPQLMHHLESNYYI